jgi:Tfp pilus assembly protein PilE
MVANKEKMPFADGPDKQSEKGFTLLETSIALIVMMVMTLATGSLFVYAVKYNSGTGDRAAALAIAQQRLERLRRTPYTDTLMTTPSTTETVTAANRTYTVVTTICSTSDCGGSATLKIITIAVTPQSVNAWANTPATITSQRASPSTGPYEGV